MAHLSEATKRLSITQQEINASEQLFQAANGLNEVCFLRLPIASGMETRSPLENAGEVVEQTVKRLGNQATLIIFGDTVDLVHIHAAIENRAHYQLWIAIKQTPPTSTPSRTTLTHQHLGAVIYTKYDKRLQHTKTRLAYTYCPSCNKTTKDYGGKKHTYDAYGTLISDIWRDISVDANGNIDHVYERFADLFGLDPYRELRVFDLTKLLGIRLPKEIDVSVGTPYPEVLESQLLKGDCLIELRKLPSNSVDFAFADPPYNLKKEYRGYSDDLEISKYFAWCDEWITEIARVLRPGGTFALLNIPLWSIRHFLHLETVLQYQNWIAWDALSFPVRLIMPAHYTILCFSKGDPRPLPGLLGNAGDAKLPDRSLTFDTLMPLGEKFCLRASCIINRRKTGLNDRGILSDLWWDIHRLKHNSRRVDHPCQLPPQLMYRLITLFTQPDEVVLDCFNGAGTTTLAASQLGRRFIGIEREQKYYEIALQRHSEIQQGMNPFRKEERKLTAKNSPVARLKKQKYEVPKKTLQLEVRRVAQLLQRLPNRDEMILHGKYPIRYYDEYFSSWGEVCAAARNTGMSEKRESEVPEGSYAQKRLF